MTGWNCDDESGGSPCDGWTGVQCVGGRISGMDMTGKGLTGPVPESFFTLTNMENLQLGNNLFSGPLPSLTRMTNLQRLDFRNNVLGTDATSRRLSIGPIIDATPGKLLDPLYGADLQSSEGMAAPAHDDATQRRFLSWDYVEPDLLQYANARNLTYLDFSGNGYIGQIPPELCVPPLRTLIVDSLETFPANPNNFSCIARCLREKSGLVIVMRARLPVCPGPDTPTASPSRQTDSLTLNKDTASLPLLQRPEIVGAIIVSVFMVVALALVLCIALYRRAEHRKLTDGQAVDGWAQKKNAALDIRELRSVSALDTKSKSVASESEDMSHLEIPSVVWSESASGSTSRSSSLSARGWLTVTSKNSSDLSFPIVVQSSQLSPGDNEDDERAMLASQSLGCDRYVSPTRSRLYSPSGESLADLSTVDFDIYSDEDVSSTEEGCSGSYTRSTAASNTHRAGDTCTRYNGETYTRNASVAGESYTGGTCSNDKGRGGVGQTKSLRDEDVDSKSRRAVEPVPLQKEPERIDKVPSNRSPDLPAGASGNGLSRRSEDTKESRRSYISSLTSQRRSADTPDHDLVFLPSGPLSAVKEEDSLEGDFNTSDDASGSTISDLTMGTARGRPLDSLN